MKKILLSICLAFIIVIQGISFVSCSTTNAKDFEYEEISGGINITKYIGSSKKVVVPSVIENKKVISINDNVFSGNIVLKEITLPESLNSTDFKLFKNCDSLEKITFLNKSNTILSYTQDLKSLNTVKFSEIPTNEIYCIHSMFSYIKSLENVEISKITNINEYNSLEISRSSKSLRENKFSDRTINISIPEELYTKILNAESKRKYNLVHSENDSSTYTIHTQNSSEKAINLNLPNEFRNAIKKMFSDSGYTLNSNFKVYSNDSESYYFKGTINKQEVICPISSSRIYHDPISNKYEFYESYYSNDYYNSSYLSKTMIIEKVDTVANMCIYFNCNNITVNGVNYTYDFE